MRFLTTVLFCITTILFAEPCLSQISDKDLSWLEEQEIDLLNPNSIDIESVFKKTRKIARYEQPSLVASRPEHIAKNVHRNILAIDRTRTLQDIPGFYINANDVDTPEQSYVVAQCPTLSTLTDFWDTIIHKEVRTVVTLLTSKDCGKRHCPYWKSAFLPITVSGWTIEKDPVKEVLAQSHRIPNQQIVKYVFWLKKEGVCRKLSLFHYENWPDFGAPEPELFLELLEIIDISHPEKDSPILVHCAAGIGRSGTFVAAHSLRKEVKKGATRINIPKRIVELR